MTRCSTEGGHTTYPGNYPTTTSCVFWMDARLVVERNNSGRLDLTFELQCIGARSRGRVGSSNLGMSLDGAKKMFRILHNEDSHEHRYSHSLRVTSPRSPMFAGDPTHVIFRRFAS